MRSFKVSYVAYDWSDDKDDFVEARFGTVIHAETIEGMYQNFEYETGHTAEEIVKVVELDDLLQPMKVIYEELPDPDER